MFIIRYLAFVDVALALTYYPNNTNIPSSTLGGYVRRGLDFASSAAGLPSGKFPSATGASEPVSRPSNARLSLASSSSNVQFHSDVFDTSIDWPRPLAVPHATQCWSQIASWSRSSISRYNTHVAGLSWPVTSSTSIVQLQTSKAYTFYPTDTSTYKLCDGSARVNVRPSSSTTYFNATSGTYTRTYLATPTFSPRPCDPTPQDCHIWHNKSSIAEYNEDALIDLCGNPAHGVDQPCVFGIDGVVELIYFPVKEANANASLCSGNASTITAPPTGEGPNAITTLGRTFTSGAVYMSIKALSAYVDGFNYLIGPSFTDLMLTLSTSDVSSQCDGNKLATSLDFADLNWPVPASAYNCQNRCGHFHIQGSEIPSQCSTIWSDVNPLLAIPTKITELSPLWATCAFEVPSLANYWFDPPIALQEQQVMAVPTLSSAPESTTTAAAPSSRPLDPTPTNTHHVQPITEASSSSATKQPTETLIPLTPIVATSNPAQSEAAPPEPIESNSTPTSPDAATSGVGENDPEVPSPSTLGGTSHSQDTADPALTSSEPSTVVPPAISILTEALSSLQSSLPSTISIQDPTSVPVSSTGRDPEGSPQSSAIVSSDYRQETVAQTSDHNRPGSETLGAGQVIIISGTPVSGKSNGIALISHSTTIEFTQISRSTPSTPAAGSLTLVASNVPGNTDAVDIDGNLISVGGPAATVSGNVVSKASSGLVLHGSTTMAFADVAPSSAVQQEDPPGSMIAADSFMLTASSPKGTDAAVIIDGTTLSQDGPSITTAGRTIFYASGGLVLAGAHSTALFSNVQTQSSDADDFDETTWALGSLTFTAAAVTIHPEAISIHGTTLSRGGSAAVINHATLTMGSSGLEVVKPLTGGRDTTLPVIASLNSTQTSSPLVTTTASTSRALVKQPPDATATSSHSGAENSLRGVNRIRRILFGCWILYIASNNMN